MVVCRHQNIERTAVGWYFPRIWFLRQNLTNLTHHRFSFEANYGRTSL